MSERKQYFFLSYFDTGLNKRIYYLNRTAFETEERAREEWRLIKQEDEKRKKLFFNSSRTKWALEKNINGRYVIVESNLS